MANDVAGAIERLKSVVNEAGTIYGDADDLAIWMLEYGPPLTVNDLRTILTAIQDGGGVTCGHEAYQGQCVHCGVKIVGGRAILSNQGVGEP